MFRQCLNLLLIDNYDSYTFNLYRYLEDLRQELLLKDDFELNILVVQQDNLFREFGDDEAEAKIDCTFDLEKIHGIIISPGPGKVPDDIGQIGLFFEKKWKELQEIPIFGVCLGHQILGFFGEAEIVLADRPVHGETFSVDLWPHPVLGEKRLEKSSKLRVTASCHEIGFHRQICMALEHKSFPWFGVQFHPESIGTEHGKDILYNFVKLAVLPKSVNRICLEPANLQAFNEGQKKSTAVVPRPLPSYPTPSSPKLKYEIMQKSIPFGSDFDVEGLFRDFVHRNAAGTSFWLDSSLLDLSRARYSYMGNDACPGSFLLAYDVARKTVRLDHHGKDFVHQTLDDGLHLFLKGLIDSFVASETNKESLVPFKLGLVGFFGYEMCFETLPCISQKLSVNDMDDHNDSVFLMTWNCISIDFLVKTITLSHAYFPVNSTYDVIKGFRIELPAKQDASKWIQETDLCIQKLLRKYTTFDGQSVVGKKKPLDENSMACLLEAGGSSYVSKAEKCQEYMRLGLSYELCLTTQVKVPLPVTLTSEKKTAVDALSLYLDLRKDNPSTYAAFFNFPTLKLSILSSSPECFLQVRNGSKVTMKPIKGTVKRNHCHEVLSDDQREELHSVKNRAENIMIVDLIRHDLSSICHDVKVPKLFSIETYETVYQLVSTVTGELNDGYGVFDILKATFPPGSMTGAPKVSSVQLLQELEEEKRRGIYSGCLGFIDLDQRNSLFSVVIRTIVLDWKKRQASIGAGGAVVMLSDAVLEESEMRLKALSVLPTLSNWFLSSLSSSSS